MFGNAPAPFHLQYVSQEDTRIPKVELPFAAATVISFIGWRDRFYEKRSNGNPAGTSHDLSSRVTDSVNTFMQTLLVASNKIYEAGRYRKGEDALEFCSVCIIAWKNVYPGRLWTGGGHILHFYPWCSQCRLPSFDSSPTVWTFGFSSGRESSIVTLLHTGAEKCIGNSTNMLQPERTPLTSLHSFMS